MDSVNDLFEAYSVPFGNLSAGATWYTMFSRLATKKSGLELSISFISAGLLRSTFNTGLPIRIGFVKLNI